MIPDESEVLSQLNTGTGVGAINSSLQSISPKPRSPVAWFLVGRYLLQARA